MKKTSSSPFFDLEQRTLRFARGARIFVGKIPRSIAHDEDCRQLLRASGSIGSNYLGANDAPTKKDFALRIKLTRKEAKESAYWLNLLYVSRNEKLEQEREKLIQESEELTKIFGAILEKTR